MNRFQNHLLFIVCTLLIIVSLVLINEKGKTEEWKTQAAKFHQVAQEAIDNANAAQAQTKEAIGIAEACVMYAEDLKRGN